MLLARLHQFQDIAIDLQIVAGDLDLGLHAAKLHVVPRKFGQGRDQCIAALVRGLIDLGVGAFDLPAYPAPEVQFPGSVEAAVEFVDRIQGDAAARRGSKQTADQTDDAVLAVLLALVLVVAVERRKFGSGDHAALETALGETQRSGPDVEIGRGNALFEVGEDGIAKNVPPDRIGRRRQPRTRHSLPVVAKERHLRKVRIGPHKIGTNGAARDKGARAHRGQHVPDHSEVHQWAPPGAPPPPVLGDSRKQKGTTMKATVAQ